MCTFPSALVIIRFSLPLFNRNCFLRERDRVIQKRSRLAIPLIFIREFELDFFFILYHARSPVSDIWLPTSKLFYIGIPRKFLFIYLFYIAQNYKVSVHLAEQINVLAARPSRSRSHYVVKLLGGWGTEGEKPNSDTRIVISDPKNPQMLTLSRIGASPKINPNFDPPGGQ